MSLPSLMVKGKGAIVLHIHATDSCVMDSIVSGNCCCGLRGNGLLELRYTSQAGDTVTGCMLSTCFEREILYRPRLSMKPSGLMHNSVKLMLHFVS